MLNVGNDSESSEGDDDEQPEALSGGIDLWERSDIGARALRQYRQNAI